MDFAQLQELSKRFDKALPQGVKWLDDTRFLVHRLPPGAEPDDAAFLHVVDAVTGHVSPFFDVDKMTTAFAAFDGIEEEAAGKIARRKKLLLLADHAEALVTHDGAVYRYTFGATQVRRITADGKVEGAQLAPGGEDVAFVRDHDIHVVSVSGGPERRLTQDGAEERRNGRLDWVYQEEIYGRGTWDGFWWSPDASRIAFLQLDESPVARYPVFDHVPVLGREETWRYPKAGEPNPTVRVGCISAAGGDVVWFDLDEYPEDDRLVVWAGWTPDGKSVVVEVTDRIKSRLDLLLCDPATGSVRRVLREEGQPWVHRSKVTWVDDDRFLWMSTRDGWMHLYLHRSDGSLDRRLTEGEFEVIALPGHKDGVAYAVTNESGILERQLWRIPLDGGPRQQITHGRGVHGATPSPGFVHALHVSHSAEHPGASNVIELTDGSVVQEHTEAPHAELAESGFVAPEFIRIPNGHGFEMEAMLFRPPGIEPGTPMRTLVCVYGGPHAPLVRDQWAGIGALWRSDLARRGILVCVVDPQSASGKGDVSAYAMHRKAGETELRDLHAALDWLVAEGLSDPEHFGIFGWSYGGFMASYALTRSKRFRVGIAGAPVTDWRNYDTVYTEQYMGLPSDNEDGYAASSIVGHAGDLSGELLLIHGTMDENVHLSNSIQFVSALQKAGKTFRFMVYPGNRHGVTDTAQQAHLYTMMTDFLEERL